MMPRLAALLTMGPKARSSGGAALPRQHESQLDQEQLEDTTSGPWNFFLLFTRRSSEEAEVLGVCNTRQVASLELVIGPEDAAGLMPRSA